MGTFLMGILVGIIIATSIVAILVRREMHKQPPDELDTSFDDEYLHREHSPEFKAMHSKVNEALRGGYKSH